MTSILPPRLLAFVRSRVSMVEHDFSAFDGETSSHADQRAAVGTYSVSQAFFYAADLWVDKPPLVSVKALEYANQRWGDQAQKVWTLKRAEIPRVDGCKVSQSGLIYEHVTTGGMFREFIRNMLTARAGVLDAFAVALWLHENFQTAWVTRDEDKALTAAGYKSRRGATLHDALARYRECGIEICARPSESPSVVCAGDTVLADEDQGDDLLVNEPENDLASRRTPNATDKYSPFFEAVEMALKKRNSRVTLAYQKPRYYAELRGFGVPGARKVVLLLDAPRGATVRTPVLSFEAVTAEPGVEPATEGWAAMRDICFGPEWRLSYGSEAGVANTLCRCKRALAVSFDVADGIARDEAAAEAAARIEAEWAAFHE